MKLKFPPIRMAGNIRNWGRSFSMRKACLLVLTGATLASPFPAAAAQNPRPTFGSPGFVWGANYVPARRMTSYQVWWRFDPEQIDREIGYAEKIHLNSLRMWLSYEYWKEDPKGIEANFDKLLEIANRHKIKILISLFDCDGVAPTQENMKNESPVTGVATASPSWAVINKPERWHETYAYVDWFMERYKDDSRVLAIELTNEPAGGRSKDFAADLLVRAASMRGTIPLTMGCMVFAHNDSYVDKGLDVLQSHPNFELSEAGVAGTCATVLKYTEKYQKPVWLTEWQRIRQSGLGWNRKLPAREERLPNYAPFCEILKKKNTQGFFWSLMVRPSYLKVHSHLRWFNGVFHEDGSVYSLEDARSIANNPNLQLTEKHELPEWAKDVDWDSDCKDAETPKKEGDKQAMIK